MTLLLVIGLVAAGGVLTLLTGAHDLFSAFMSFPDATTLLDLERKARAAR